MESGNIHKDKGHDSKGDVHQSGKDISKGRFFYGDT